MKVSSCCGATVYVAGRTTHYYVCESCEMPCDVNDSEERKRESFKNELRAVISSIKAWLYLRRIEREKDRIAAGIYTKEEQRTNLEAWKV